MKKFTAKYMLYIYLNFIKEDLTIYKKWALPIIKILIFFNYIYIYIASVIFFPFFLIGMIVDNKIKNNI